MHSFCLGITRQIFRLTFKVGDNPRHVAKNPDASVTSRRLDPYPLGQAVSKVKLPTECERRTRPVDDRSHRDLKATGTSITPMLFSTIKLLFHACIESKMVQCSIPSSCNCHLCLNIFSEWRNLLLICGPLVLENIPPGQERQIWEHLVIICRYLTAPPEEVALMSTRHVKERGLHLQKLVQKCYGKRQLHYNLHIAGHVDKLRIYGQSGHYFSTFSFEGMYAQLKASIVPGEPFNNDLTHFSHRHFHSSYKLLFFFRTMRKVETVQIIVNLLYRNNQHG